jgi:hypothetical protein
MELIQLVNPGNCYEKQTVAIFPSLNALHFQLSTFTLVVKKSLI